MPIRELAVTNFKSFRNLEIRPDNFNIVIGSNASGQSNFIQIFKFIRDIAKYGLNNAISLQGGVEYMRNTLIGGKEDFSLRIVYALEEKKREVIGIQDTLPVFFEPFEITYEFCLRFMDSGENFEICRDNLIIAGTFLREGPGITGQPGTGAITLCNENQSVSFGILLRRGYNEGFRNGPLFAENHRSKGPPVIKHPHSGVWYSAARMDIPRYEGVRFRSPALEKSSADHGKDRA